MKPKAAQKVVPPKDGLKRRSHKKKMLAKAKAKAAHEAEPQHVWKIGEARKELPQMVNSVGSGETASYVVGPYGKPSAALVSYERFRPLLAQGTKSERFALLIADELLADAPPHLWAPAIRELSALPKSDLITLWQLTSASSDSEIASIRTRLGHPEVLDRLVVRMRVATAISEARKAGVYDTIEDMTSGSLSPASKA